MAQLPHLRSTPRTRSASVALGGLASRQFGVVSRRQLLELGFSPARITALVERGHVHRLLPGAYAVGHRATTWEGNLVAALFWVGAGAALSHLTAATWWGLADHRD